MESDLGYGDGYCGNCGRRISQRQRFCAHCGRQNGVLDQGPRASGAGMASLGGWLLLVSAGLSFLSLPLLTSYLDSMDFGSYGILIFSLLSVFQSVFHYIAGTLAVLGVITVFGGVAAIFRGSYWWARAGGVASVFSMAGVIGLAGLILICASKNEFRNEPAAEQGNLGPQRPPGAHREGGSGLSPGESIKSSLFVGR